MATKSAPVLHDRSQLASWLWLGLLTVCFYGIAGYLTEDVVAPGLMSGGGSALLVIGAFAMWQRAQRRHPVPAAEYLALVWLLAYGVLLIVNVVIGRRVQILDWVFLLPPLSLLPIGARWIIGDDGAPRGWARSAAYYLHMTAGVILVGFSLLLIVTVYLIFAAPLSLVPGIMHLRAGHLYHLARQAQAAKETP